jgi:4-oxalocrotonate tautomerase
MPALDAKEVINMPILRVSLWSGRTKEQKVELAKALTETMTKVGKIPPEAVTIIFEELPKENWATKGILHSELHAG